MRSDTAALVEKYSPGAEAGSNVRGFESWMASEQRRIYLLCLRMLRNSDDADSATQDTFLKAYRALERDPRLVLEAPEKWLTRIAVNTCLDQVRSKRWCFWKRRVGEPQETAILQLLPASTPGQERLVAARELAGRITAALGRLSPRQRAVFVLRHEEDRSIEDIGEILGLDTGTVKAHMARAVGKLRHELRDWYGR